MSFGFSVGDFFAAFQLTHKILKEFVDAPSQFKAVSDDVQRLSIVLQKTDIAFPNEELCNNQKRDLEEIDKGCRNVLDELQRILDKNIEISPESGTFGKRIKRAWKRLNWKPEEIKQLRSRINTNIGLLDAFNGRLTRDNVARLVRHQEDQGRQTVLNWLTTIDFAFEQSDFIRRREAGTGQWLLDSTKFQAWIKTNQQVLFCPGIPGAGKTILTSIVIDYLYANFQKDTNIGIAYIYCNFRRQDEQKPEGLLASLLKQLAQSLYPLPESVKSLYNNHKEKRTQPTFNEISSTLQSVAALYSRSFIVVDALDECQESDGCRTKLLKEIFALQARSGANIFSTSRYIPNINEHFKNSTQLEIRASDHDVQRYLDGHMLELSRCVIRSSKLQGEIKAEIVKAVNGMFLLAQLHFQLLKGKTSPKAIRTALGKLSTGNDAYDDAYNDAMERIEGQLAGEKELSKQVLSWITCAKRPLTTSELEHALAVEVGELQFDEENLSPIEDMVSVCAGLVTVDEESAIIRLVHYTTQEYFEQTQKCWFPDAETDIAEVCVTYLSFNDFETGICHNDEQFEERLQLNPLYNYASHNWGHHARNASRLIPEVIIFLDTKAQVEASSQVLLARKLYALDSGYSQRFARQMSGLHLAAYFGLKDAVNSSLQISLSAQLKHSSGWTPLSWAAGMGHEAVVQLLLDKGAEVDTKDGEYGQTPLSQAAGSGHEVVVRLLLDKGAEVDIKDGYSQTPLSRAAASRHKAVVQLLIDKGAKASGSGYEAVVQLLLDKGAEVDTKAKDGQTPLSWAVASGHKAVVQLLIDKGAKVDTNHSYSQKLLSRAAESGNEVVVRLLLDKGAEVDIKDGYSQTPLSRAAASRHKAVVQLLIDKGAKVDTKDREYGQSPLSQAAANGHEAVVQMLLDKGAKVDIKDSYSQTPLSRAAASGYKAVVQLLLDKGAKLDTMAKDGQTPLSWAAASGHEAMVQLLIDKGAKVDTKDGYGRTPLSRAAASGYKAVVQLLLDKGAEVDTKDRYSQTPLFRSASSHGHEAVMLLLLDKGAKVDTKDDYGQTPLSRAASSHGHVTIVQLLLDKDAEVDTKDCHGRTPLSLAAASGHEAVVQRLIDKGAEVDTKDGYGRTPLSRAASSHSLVAVVQLLLDKGAEVDTKDHYGRTPLSLAAASSRAAVVQLLLDKGAKVDTKDRYGRTPLSRAVERGHEVVRQILLRQGALMVEDLYGLT
ncbi:hypothetical protein V494_02233 [Pseudogymnoascus sp. VKM F-4513 (FW-928)]|nr:hypothetical protein V494_02233 [Pseudogymnoascus sp. VKM F-4513 (FW-928)]